MIDLNTHQFIAGTEGSKLAPSGVGWQQEAKEFRRDVLQGLRRHHKQLPCKYFYDERGSRLFDAICELDEYYVTRTELAIMRRHAGAMADCVGRDAILIELGSGSSTKTPLLLRCLESPVAYVPIDISREHLLAAARGLARAMPTITILPVIGDFTDELKLPATNRPARRQVVYFPGSTIGNFSPDGTRTILARIAGLAGPGGGALIGIDLVKDPEVLNRAYNDSRGITAQFNLNLLKRINRELGGTFDLSSFAHAAAYDPRHRRVEMRLISRRAQTVCVGGEAIEFQAGEAIVTEHSHKHTLPGFAALAAGSGLTLRRSWVDDSRHFAVLYFDIPRDPSLAERTSAEDPRS